MDQQRAYNLAWRGITLRDMRELFALSLRQRAQLQEGSVKDRELRFLSTCYTIIGTAIAGIAEANGSLAPTTREEWTTLHDECVVRGKEALALAEKDGRNDWTSSDCEVAGAFILKTEGSRPERIKHAKELFASGRARALAEKNTASFALLTAQSMRAAIALKNIAEVTLYNNQLNNAISEDGESEGSESFDHKVLARLYRASAEGAIFLKDHHAKAGESENQQLKGKALHI